MTTVDATVMTDRHFPGFIYGAQYYRAPTPDENDWRDDFSRMKQLGFNHVKFWLQWRWSEPEEGRYDWNDLDRLLRLAEEFGLAATLNLIFDVAPAWMFRRYPDAVMVDAAGRRIGPVANVCRQIGGYPGPCCLHPAMLDARKRFWHASLVHFRDFPALKMYDVWNEPEHNLMTRAPARETLLCYCEHCAGAFRDWLHRKYGTLDVLNRVWGRCYADWDEIELPREPATVNDFCDWREFQLDKLTGDAVWRLEMVRALDPGRAAYLHVVADSLNCFNSVTGVDDFALAEHCDLFASTILPDTLQCIQAVSAARGRHFFNAEWHVNFGSAAMHQRMLEWPVFLREALVQVGLGVRGFLYWQYHAETLGIESPGWGLVHTDGTSRPVTTHAADFIRQLAPVAERLSRSVNPLPEIGIWRSRRNEIFHYCMHDSLDLLHHSITAYTDMLYALNLPARIVSGTMAVCGDWQNLKLLILPSAYMLSRKEAESIDVFARSGGVVVIEGHPGAYDSDTGRHSRTVPGCGLAERWDIRETDSTSSYHLPEGLDISGNAVHVSGDVRKALLASGMTGGEYFPLETNNGAAGAGALRLALIKAKEPFELLAGWHGRACVIRKPIGRGAVYYAGTLLGHGSLALDAFLRSLLLRAAEEAGVARLYDGPVHVDIAQVDGIDAFVTLRNLTTESALVKLSRGIGAWRPVFGGGDVVTDGVFTVDAHYAQLYVRVE